MIEPVSTQAPRLRGRVMMNQDWRDLTFLHWAVAARSGRAPDAAGRAAGHARRDDVRRADPVPHGRRRPRRGPGVPWAGTFLETNVRLYSVDATGRRGIVFLSLDTDRSIVVAGARVGFGLPYRWARMRYAASGVGPHLHVVAAVAGRPGPSRVVVRAGEPRAATPLDEFVSARWGLHVRWWGRTLYVANQHEPWPVHDAEVLELDDGLLGSVGLGELAGRRRTTWRSARVCTRSSPSPATLAVAAGADVGDDRQVRSQPRVTSARQRSSPRIPRARSKPAPPSSTSSVWLEPKSRSSPAPPRSRVDTLSQIVVMTWPRISRSPRLPPSTCAEQPLAVMWLRPTRVPTWTARQSPSAPRRRRRGSGPLPRRRPGAVGGPRSVRPTGTSPTPTRTCPASAGRGHHRGRRCRPSW